MRHLTITLLLVLGAACGPGTPDTDSVDREPEAQPVETPWLRVLVPAEPATDPFGGRRPFQLELWRYVYSSLVHLEPAASAGRTGGAVGGLPIAEPDLALAWTWDEESRGLLLSLDPARRWSDGNRVRAQDVVRSYRFLEERNLLPTRPGPRGSGRGAEARIPADEFQRDPRGRDRILREITAGGDSLVTLRFVPGVPLWLALEVAAVPVLSGIEIDLTTGDLEPEPGVPPPAPLRSASFRLEPQGSTQGVSLAVRRQSGHRVSPQIEGLLTEVLPGDPGRIERILRGESDIALDVAAEGIARRVHDETVVQIYAGAVGSIEMLLWNVGRTEIDADLREAVDLSLDRVRIARLFSVGSEVYASEGGGFFQDPDSTSRPDLERAAGILGYPAMPPPGAPPRRFLTLLYDRNNQTREQIATFLEEDLSRIGIALRPIPLEGPEVFQRYLDGDFEAALLGFQPPLSPDLSGLFASWGSWNGMGYESTVTDSLLRESYQSEGEDVLRLARLVEQQIRRERPALFLVRRQRLDLVRSRVRGFDGSAWLPLGHLGQIHLEP